MNKKCGDVKENFQAWQGKTLTASPALAGASWNTKHLNLYGDRGHWHEPHKGRFPASLMVNPTPEMRNFS